VGFAPDWQKQNQLFFVTPTLNRKILIFQEAAIIIFARVFQYSEGERLTDPARHHLG
jgi:hypothetical protein